ncbi:MAG: general stress protein [Halobacteriovoraceae bacterium]|nr:general stress protein [Halobacteriovoraceae bacterium]
MSVKDRGFASMDPAKQREIASKGGKASPKNFKNRPEAELREIARKGGRASHRVKSNPSRD